MIVKIKESFYTVQSIRFLRSDELCEGRDSVAVRSNSNILFNDNDKWSYGLAGHGLTDLSDYCLLCAKIVLRNGSTEIRVAKKSQVEIDTEREKMISDIADMLTDEQALTVIDAYEEWKPYADYSANDRKRYNGRLYKCIQAHTSQDDWTPDSAASLWTVISLDEFPDWIQPIGAADAYAAGAKVSHDRKHWVSDVDANVWMPSVYGWSEI